jgi:hypothetical protein
MKSSALPALLLALATLPLLRCGFYRPFPYASSEGDSPNGISLFLAVLQERGMKIKFSAREQPGRAYDLVLCFDPLGKGLDEETFHWCEQYLSENPNSLLVFVAKSFAFDLSFWQDQWRTFPAGRKQNQGDEEFWKNLPHLRHPGPLFPLGPLDDEGGMAEKLLPLRNHLGQELGARVVPGCILDLPEDWGPYEIATTDAGCHAAFLPLDEEGEETNGILYFSSAYPFLNYSMVRRENRDALFALLNGFLQERKSVLVVRNLGGDSDDRAKPPHALLAIFPFNWIAGHFLVVLVLTLLARSAIVGYPPAARRTPFLPFAEHLRALGARLASTGNVQRAVGLIAAWFQRPNPPVLKRPEEAIQFIRQMMEDKR